MKLTECPECRRETLKTMYDNPNNNGFDVFVCINKECRWSG